MGEPSTESSLAKRLAERQQALAAATSRFAVISTWRVIVFVAALTFAWLGFDRGQALYMLSALGLLLGFVGLLFVHEATAEAQRRLQRSVGFYERLLARLSGTWRHLGAPKEQAPAGHLYAADLDLTGPGSLFHLLCEAHTRTGRERLLSWLLEPAEKGEIAARQAAVRELAGKLDWREALVQAGAAEAGALDVQSLRTWAEAPPVEFSIVARVALHAVTGLSLAAILAWAVGDVKWPFMFTLPMVLITDRALHPKVKRVLQGLNQPVSELRSLASLVTVLRSSEATFDAPWLHKRVQRVAVEAPIVLRRLARLVDWFESRRNQLFAVPAYLLLWESNFGWLIERWRVRHGARSVEWLDIVADLEALASLAQHASLRERLVFAEVVEDLVVRGDELRHPLLPAAAVSNPISLDSKNRFWMVSGSNMSGKSTYLRTVGLNVVLGLAGAAVHADRFVLASLQVAASMRVQDSLHDGASRFYAEIVRLKDVVNCASSRPTLCLLDEILSGTNSADRRTGTIGVLRALLPRPVLGLITTHDLSLTESMECVQQKHFVDDLKGGELVFDYRVREGVVSRSNAVALMARVGLPV